VAGLRYEVGAPINPAALQHLFDTSWDGRGPRYRNELEHSLAWVAAYDGEQLAGFVNIAWNGGAHAFVLDTTVHPEQRRRGIGRELVRIAAEAAREAGCEWLHVDFEPQFAPFYEACGFGPTAGLMRLAP
jgi:GNAT superfamily N-acetyltransferase